MDLVADAQARLDALKTNKERKRRLKELKQLQRDSDGYATADLVIEYMALRLRLEGGPVLSAKECMREIRMAAMERPGMLAVRINDEPVVIPQEVIRGSH